MTIVDFQLSNTLGTYESKMDAKEQQWMFNEIGVKTFYIRKLFVHPQRATVIFKDQKMFYEKFL